jgi:hypothetical protein
MDLLRIRNDQGCFPKTDWWGINFLGWEGGRSFSPPLLDLLPSFLLRHATARSTPCLARALPLGITCARATPMGPPLSLHHRSSCGSARVLMPLLPTRSRRGISRHLQRPHCATSRVFVAARALASTVRCWDHICRRARPTLPSACRGPLVWSSSPGQGSWIGGRQLRGRTVAGPQWRY